MRNPEQAAEIAAAIALNVRELRSERKLSLDDLAKAAGVTKSHVWEIEKGNSTNPTITTCINLARALGVSVGYLTGLSTSTLQLHPDAIRIACEIDVLLRRPSPTSEE